MEESWEAVKQFLSNYWSSNTIQRNNNDIQVIKSQLFQWIAVKAIPLTSIYCDTFSCFVKSLTQLELPLNKRNLRQGVIDYANSLVNKDRHSIPQYYSILTDGATKAHKIWTGVITFHNGNISFQDIIHVQNQQSITIATELSKIINRLRAQNIIVVSIVNDNAMNERAILEESHSYCIQQQTNLPIVRVPCSAHTINLAICDFLHETHLMKKVLEIYSKIGNHFNCPTFIKCRWFSIYDIVLFIEEHITQISDLFKRQRYHDSMDCLQTINWNLLIETLKPVITFLHLVERDSAKLSDIFPWFFSCQHQLESMYNQWFNYPEIMEDKLLKRFTSTHEWQYVTTTFFLTPKGVVHFNRFDPSLQSIYFNIIAQTIERNAAQLNLPTNSLKNQVTTFLSTKWPEIDSIDFWNSVEQIFRLCHIKVDDHLELIEIGKRLIQFPSSEAAVERLFSHLRYLFGSYRMSMGDDLIKALIQIRMYYHFEGKSHSIDETNDILKKIIDSQNEN
jgi:hypothetical protein